MTREERYGRALDVLRQVNGEAGQRVVDSLAAVSSELGHRVMAWAFGDTPRPAEVGTPRPATGHAGHAHRPGGCEPQPGVHVNGALNVDPTPTEIVEVLLHPAVQRGMPRALNATTTAKTVFAERGLLPVT